MSQKIRLSNSSVRYSVGSGGITPSSGTIL